MAVLDEELADVLVDGEVDADVGGDAHGGGDDAAIKPVDTAFSAVDLGHDGTHAGGLDAGFGVVLSEVGNGSGLDGEARAHNVERVGSNDRNGAGNTTRGETFNCGELVLRGGGRSSSSV